MQRDVYDEAKKRGSEVSRRFSGKDNYFLELQDHGIPAAEDGEPGAAAHEPGDGHSRWWPPTTCHYTYAEDAKPHDILLCIQTGKKLADEDRMRYEGGQYYLQIPGGDASGCSPMPKRPLTIPIKSQSVVNVEIEFGVTKLPRYDVPEGYTSWEYLNKLCDEGFARALPGR